MFQLPLLDVILYTFSDGKLNLLCLILTLDTSEKSSALSLLHPPFRYLQTLIGSTHKPPLFQTELSQLSQTLLTGEVLQSLEHFGCPLLDSFQYVHEL